jgi:hypothetical protein
VGALGADDYVRLVQPYSSALIEPIRATGASDSLRDSVPLAT